MSRRKKQQPEKNIFLEIDNGRQIWTVSFFWPDKSRIRRRCPDFERAKALKTKIENSILFGTWPQVKKELGGVSAASQSMIVSKLADLHFEEYCLIEHDKETAQFKRQHLKKIKQIIGNVRIADFTMDDAEFLKRQRKNEGVSPDTVNKTLAVACKMFNWAVEVKKLMTVNPMSRYKHLKVTDRKERRDLQPEEARRIIEEAFKIDPLIACFIAICAECALRPWKEGLGLKRHYFDMRPRVTPEDERWLFIERSKHQKRGRRVPLSDFAIECANQLPHFFSSDFLFVRPETGKPPSKKYIVKVLFAAEKAAGITWPRMYDMRHFRCTYWMSNGAPVINVQAWMGHQRIQTTMIYARPANEAENFRDAHQRELERLKKQAGGGENLETA